MNKEIRELQSVLFNMLVEFREMAEEKDIKFFLVGGTALGAVRHGGFIPWDDDIDIAMMRDDFEKMEGIMKSNRNKLGSYYYSPVEGHLIPEAPIGYLYDMIEVNGKFIANGKIDIHPIDNVPEGKLGRIVQKFSSIAYYFSVYRHPVKNKGKVAGYISRILLKIVPKSIFCLCMKTLKNIITRWNNRDSKEICSLFGVAGYGKEVMPRAYVEPFQIGRFENEFFNIPGDAHQYLQRLYGDYMKLPPVEEQRPQMHYNGYRS